MKILNTIIISIAFLMGASYVSAKEILIINVATEKGGTFSNGTLSLIDDNFKGTWSRTKNGVKEKTNIELTSQEFIFLWNEVVDAEVFTQHAVFSPDAVLETSTNYVVGVTYFMSDTQGVQTYLIPHRIKSERLQKWLSVSGYN